jgi:hypothetical protein
MKTIEKIEWNAETEQWEVNGKPYEGEILYCTGWHDGLQVHDAWWCTWFTQKVYDAKQEKK